MAIVRPELMAIGDSGYNGIRSLTIDDDRARMAVPAQVARAYDWPFAVPSYPEAIVGDLERVLFNLRDGAPDPLARLPHDARANGLRWLTNAPWAGRPLFHNLAIGQLTTADLLKSNHADALADARALLRPDDPGAELSLAQVPALYQSLNTAFVLHPAGPADSPSRTPVDMVADANPRRLLIQVGPNDGLWSLLLQADASGFRDKLFDRLAWTRLAEALERRCPEIEHIYVNLLPRPRTIANVIGAVDARLDADGYYPTYRSALLNMGIISGETMREVDQFIAGTANPGIQASFARLGRRVHFVDAYALTSDNDFKHDAEAPADKITLRIGGEDRHISNYPLHLLGDGIGFGGLYSLDNLHPSAVGYGVLARAVCRAIAEHEGLDPLHPIDLQACADADPVMSKPPPVEDVAIGLESLVTFAVAYFTATRGAEA